MWGVISFVVFSLVLLSVGVKLLFSLLLWVIRTSLGSAGKVLPMFNGVATPRLSWRVVRWLSSWLSRLSVSLPWWLLLVLFTTQIRGLFVLLLLP